MRYTNALFAAIMLIVCACALASAEQPAEIGAITYVEGRVDVLRSGSEKWVPASDGTSLSVGDSVRTKSSAKAEATFKDKTIMRIAQNSRIDIKDYQLDANNNRRSADIMIERGKARTIIAKMRDAAGFKLCTPNSCGTVKGSDIFTFYQSGNSGILVAEGALSVFNPARPDVVLKVPAGNAAIVPLEDAPKGPRKYLDIEQKSYEQDTSIPETLSTRKGAAVIKGVIAKFTGDVKVTPKGSDAAHPAVLGEIVNEGDKIVTGANGIVEIMLDNGNAIYLKQNTDITILRLVIDAKTGEFENLFGTEKGDVKARIEGLKGKSKFEVKTPTALCGARGTIMLIHVAPDGATNSFFEGGNGYTTNLVSGQTMDVGAGTGASTDVGGGVAGSGSPSGDDRAGMDDGFDPNGGTGDSSEGASGGGLADAGLGGSGTTNLVSDAVDAAGASAGDTIDAGDVVDVPITDVIPEEEQEEDAGLTHGTLIGNFSYSDAVTPQLFYAGDLYDLAMAADFAKLWTSSVGYAQPVTFTGNYDITTPSEFLIWTADAIYPYDSAAGTYTTSDGGAYYIFAGGSRGSSSLEGLLIGFYIDPSGNAGTLQGDFSGTDASDFALSGQAYATIHSSEFDISPEDLVYSVDVTHSLNGAGSMDFITGGSMAAQISDGSTLEIASTMAHTWGIWMFTVAGSYVEPATAWSTPFDLELAGTAPSAITGQDDGAWLQVMTVNTWSGNKVSANLNGIYFSVHSDGTMAGGTLTGKGAGNYVDVAEAETGGWQAVGCGEWIEVNSSLNVANMATLTADIQNLNPMNVPITVAESSIMSGVGAFANGTALSVSSMNINFLESVSGANNGVWAALVSGTFDTAYPRVDTWSVTVNDASVGTATLTGTQWSGGAWRADVNGTSAGNRNFTGTAAGTYSDGNGTFNGAGAGQWKKEGGGEAVVGQP